MLMLEEVVEQDKENLAMMQQGNGGLSKKGSASVKGKKKAGGLNRSLIDRSGRATVYGKKTSSKKKKGNSKASLIANAAGVKASDADWAAKGGKRSGSGTAKGARKMALAPGAAAAVRASNDMW